MIFAMFVLVVVAFVAAAVYSATTQANARKALAAALAQDGTLQLLPTASTVVGVRTRAPLRELEARASANGVTTWFLTSSLPRVAARTTLHLERRRASDALKELVGVHDVQTNDAQVDQALSIRGTDADVVRGIVQTPAVVEALRSFFVVRGGVTLDVGSDGTVVVAIEGRGIDETSIRGVFKDAIELLDVLDAHADAAPQGDQRALSGGVGAGSGTPFVVPLGERR